MFESSLGTVVLGQKYLIFSLYDLLGIIVPQSCFFPIRENKQRWWRSGAFILPSHTHSSFGSGLGKKEYVDFWHLVQWLSFSDLFQMEWYTKWWWRKHSQNKTNFWSGKCWCLETERREYAPIGMDSPRKSTIQHKVSSSEPTEMNGRC